MAAVVERGEESVQAAFEVFGVEVADCAVY